MGRCSIETQLQSQERKADVVERLVIDRGFPPIIASIISGLPQEQIGDLSQQTNQEILSVAIPVFLKLIQPHVNRLLSEWGEIPLL